MKLDQYYCLMSIRGGKMCQTVEGHNITVPQKSGGPEWVYLLIYIVTHIVCLRVYALFCNFPP